jgi:hypothetical protein
MDRKLAKYGFTSFPLTVFLNYTAHPLPIEYYRALHPTIILTIRLIDLHQ